MAVMTSRSPSPAAVAPLAASPGPRAAHLIRLYNDAISHTIKTCNYDNFSSCFPATAKNEPEALQGLHRDFSQRLEEHARREFENILRERNVVAALNDLDRLVEDARKRKTKAEAQANGGPVTAPAPAHALPARSLYLAHLAPTINARQAELRERLERTHTNNADLLATLQRQRAEIHQTVAGVEKVMADVNASLEAVSADKIRTLSKETIALDTEMRDDD